MKIKQVKKKVKQQVRRESEVIVNNFLQDVMNYRLRDRLRLALAIAKGDKTYSVRRS